MKVNGAEATMLALVAEGVDVVFGYPGGTIMPTYDALFRYSDQIRHVLVRHEQAAAHAAEGYARACGKVGVCIATSGPGATNLITGIADAMMDSVPLVCITGQVARPLIGTDAFQETDIISLTIPVTKWNYQITNAAEVPGVLAKAFYIARSGRPGPVLIDIAKNAQLETLDFEYQPMSRLASYKLPGKADGQAVSSAAAMINAAERPLLLAGRGVLLSNADSELREFVERGGIPIAATLHGLSCFPVDHPLYMGMLGMHGNYAPNVLTNEADLLIAVGMRFDDRVTGDASRYAKNAKIVHIDIDSAEIGKIIRNVHPVVADAKEALSALTPLLQPRDRTPWLKRFQELHKMELDKVIAPQVHRSAGPLSMAEVVRVLSELSGGEAIVVADVGQHQMMTARYYNFHRPHSFISSGGLGTMGFALPAAMGAKLGVPGTQVIAVIGDGGFQMTLQEMATIAQESLPVKIVVLNNNFLGMVRQWQELFFERRYSFVDLKNPDFVKLSEAFGIPASRITERGELTKAFQALLDAPGPCFLEVVVEREENVFPMVPAGASVDQIRME